MEPLCRHFVAKGSGENAADGAAQKVGEGMDTEVGNTFSSSKFVSMVRRGTSTIPPPAPKIPVTAPALKPASAALA